MDTNQLLKALGDAAAASDAAQDYCIWWSDYWWWMCMTKAEWSGWMQAIGAILALTIAIGLPWCERRRQRRKDLKKAADDADITIRFHSEVFTTNENLLAVAIAHLPGGEHQNSVDAPEQITSAIGGLRAIHFDQIRTIAGHDPILAKHLADFHCELDFLTGILDRNENDVRKQKPSVADRLKRLNEISTLIKSRTVQH